MTDILKVAFALALFGLCAVVLTVKATPGQLEQSRPPCLLCWQPAQRPGPHCSPHMSARVFRMAC